ncbi:restriction endonuclease subunit S [Rhodoferax sp.]|uniref:restriction endonuclease subunit S n=1 Tax=Rhodoferax sp. TaxID=50421 RepID=UPI0025FCE906|nr:restriction endonuclease subunit S [Rhodoferax sp.]
MSDSEEVCYRALSELVSQVDAKITVRKDPTRHYVGLENIPSRGAHLTGWSLASSSISTNSIFQSGDVLFGKLRPNLRKCVVAPFDGYCSTDILVLRANTGVDPSFAGKVLRAEQVGAAAEMTSVGTKMPRTSWKHLSELEVFCPGFPEQSKIAKVLDVVDTAIHETGAIIAKLKAVKQGLLHDLLTRGIDANGELRPPQAEAPHLYKPSPLGWIPKDWDVVTLESVSKTVTSGSRDWARFYADSGALFVRIGNLTREHINFRYESTMYVRPPRNADGQRTRLESGDILISITADLGIVGVVPDDLGEAYINQHIALVRPDLDAVNSRFVGHYLAGPIAQTYISKLNDAGAKAGLNLPTIRGLVTAKPLRTEQDLIAARLDEIDNRIQNATAESAKLRELKSGLMDDLLTGRVRVTALLADAAQQKGSA